MGVDMAVAVKTISCEGWRWAVVLGLLWLGSTEGIKFDVKQQECWVHEAAEDGEFVQLSVVVVKYVNPGPYRHMGIDVVVQAPGGEYVHTEKAKLEAKFNFTAVQKGRYKLCFHNRGSDLETIILDMLHGDVHQEEPVKDEHVQSLMKQMESLSDALVDVEFEQDWLASHTDRHALILSDLSKRLVYKAVLEAFAFIACSMLQVLLLQRLLQKHVSVHGVSAAGSRH